MGENTVAHRRITSIFLVLVSVAWAQQSPPAPSIVDAAREQREIQRQHDKSAQTTKVLTNDDLVASSKTSTPDASEQSPSGVNPKFKETADSQNSSEPAIRETEASKGNSESRALAGPVLDRPQDSKPDVFVVPAGTELKVDIDQHKITVPIRIGFATAIPALSQVSVEIARSYVSVPDFSTSISYVDYFEFATLTAVTVGGDTYPVQTDSLRLLKGAINSELTFTLMAPLKILR
jgi:hypothetical protein